jgi:hypothetical protein
MVTLLVRESNCARNARRCGITREMVKNLLLATLLITIGCSRAARQVTTDSRFTDLGVQITSTLLQGSAFAKYSDGRDIVCTVIRGNPAKLLLFDVKSGSLLHRLPLGTADGGWNATTASDGSVYVSTDDEGHLFRWVPGESEAKDLGKVAAEQTFAWDVTAGADGEVFVGTYPGCMIMRYHPNDGFRDVGKGAVAEGENYARGLTYDAAGGKVYIAVGAHAHLIQLDPKTGAKRDILPAKYKGKKFCYSADVSGGKLFALITDAETAVMELKSGEFEATIPDAVAQLVLSPKSPTDERVYYNAPNKLGWYDVKTHAHGVAAENTGGILAMTWVGDQLALFSKTGGIMMFDPATKKLAHVKVEIPPEPTPIHYIKRGPDERIYVGGYLSGGLAIFDPETDKSQQFGYLPQTEGSTTLGKRVYIGGYPQARLYRFETDKPWGNDNPHLIDSLHRVGQDRPFAALGVESLNKVFFGHVPDYGTLGGALAVVDGATDAVEVHRNVIADQSIVSLTEYNGMIVGGTSIHGGLGIEPTATEAKLFIWDPAAKKVVFETVPVKGAKLVTGLLVVNQQIFGFADETLFVFDPAKREVVTTKKLLKLREERSKWRSVYLEMHPSGMIYGTAYDHALFRLDPKSLKIAMLRENENIALLAQDAAGNVYFREAGHLWRFRP